MPGMFAARARHNALRRYRPEDDPAVKAARAELRWSKLADEIQREAEADPPLTAAQRARLAVLLLSPSEKGEAA